MFWGVKSCTLVVKCKKKASSVSLFSFYSYLCSSGIMYSSENMHFIIHTKGTMNFLSSASEKTKGCCNIFPHDKVTGKWSDLLEHFWEPWLTFASNENVTRTEDRTNKGKRYSHGDRLRASHQSSAVKLHGWKISDGTAPILCSTVSLSCSLLCKGITQTCPMADTKPSLWWERPLLCVHV